ncbi:hypothetical protein, partial [Klebsiella pneumoniae]|uniref:hypothetical protein n=1 Tax=Klebsiella pneumoniae TaxID=573 RepID=UPI00385353A7
DLQNGIYYIGRKGVYKPIRIKPSERENPTGSTLSESVLDRKVTTKFAKAPIKKVIAELARQTHLRIEVDSKVPGYKLDAFL